MLSQKLNQRLLNIILELEKKFPYFKKMDVYSSVSEAFKRIQARFKNISDNELEEIKNSAIKDLSVS